MRIFRFRGHSKTHGWVEGNLHVGYKEKGGGIEYAYIYTDDGHVCRVDPNSIGEFANLYDSNGFRVYEGDIVELSPNHYNTNGSIEHGVIADHGKYLLMYGYNTPITNVRFKVIGNIYEDMDLLSPENQRYINVFHFQEDEEVE